MASKTHKLVEGNAQHVSTPKQRTDWTLCILCQENKAEPLQCPAETTRSDIGAGYTTMGEHLLQFAKLDGLPFDIQRLDDGCGIVETLTNHKAKWHSPCRLNYNKTQLNRAIKRKSSSDTTMEDETPKKFTRQSTKLVNPFDNVCLLCGKIGSKSNILHRTEKLPVGDRVWNCAMKLQDDELIAKISSGDCVSIEVKYHLPCLTYLYTRAEGCERNAKEADSDSVRHGIALAELVNYIENEQSCDDSAPVFKLSDLAKLYTQSLERMSLTVPARVHTTRLKERLLHHVPGLQAHKHGRKILLAFNTDIGLAIHTACDNPDDDGLYLTKVAQIVRKEMMKTKSCFEGSFDAGCQHTSVPPSLLSLVRMVLDGPSINPEISEKEGVPQAALSISQLILFNSHERRRPGSTSVAHTLSRETPLPIYLGVMLHSKTRKKELVDTLFELGLSVSYSRVLDISTREGNRVCDQFKAEDAVCPMKLKQNLVTAGAVDNIDHDPSSVTSHDSFHGTSISLTQQPTLHNEGQRREPSEFVPSKSTTLQSLPESYTLVPPLTMKHKEPPVPDSVGQVHPEVHVLTSQTYDAAIQTEKGWLADVRDTLDEDVGESGETHISWAAYHASKQADHEFSSGISALLTLFPDDSKTAAMISHSLSIVRDSVNKLNPDQVPFVTMDQPLYAIAKKLQWDYPGSHGEDKCVILLGGLHIEMTVLKCLGDWLNKSGWTNALVQARITSPGKADSFLKASHVTRSRHAHQVTVSCLYILLGMAYTKYTEQQEQDVQSIDDWLAMRIQQSPTVQFWYLTLNLELLLLVYVRSIREANFQLYADTLTRLAPWMFALDHTHYARWLTVHIRDMMSLHEAHPSLYAEFMNGQFVFHKTTRKFSAMALDQAHEQNNALVKGDGGAVGLTENPSALRRWMVAGPEMARLVTEFEDAAGIGQETQSSLHHEQTKSVQSTFKKEVKQLVTVFEDMGNPFLEQSSDLIVLDSKEIADPAVVKTVREVEDIGTSQYNTFLQDRLVDKKQTIYETIKKNKLPLLHCPPARGKSKSQLQVQSLKSDCSLFSRLYVSCQTRGGNLDDFFECENQVAPPSLSHIGALQTGNKATLLPILEGVVPEQEEIPVMNAMIIEGSVAVNMLNTGSCKTFNDYAETVFVPYVMGKLHVSRLDVVWDVYTPRSLKASTRAKRGQGKRRRVTPSGPIPGNWADFLKNDLNKTELFQFLAEYVKGIQLPDGKQLYLTHGNAVLANPDADVSHLEPCSQEEGDTRVFVHVVDAARTGHSKVVIRTVDTDVLVLAVSLVDNIPDLSELWIAFGTGHSYRHIPVHTIVQMLGVEKAAALPFFHAFTGCDTVSAFYSHSKVTAWKAWQSYPSVTPIFTALSSSPQQLSETHIESLERYTVIMYDRTSSEVSVNACRKHLFTKKGRQIANIPPTRDALVLHSKRAEFQAGHVWGQSVVKEPEILDPCDWGWTKDSSNTTWLPLWTILPAATKACRELIQCQCKTGCRRSRGCSCAKVQLKCTALCHCTGECIQDI